MTVVPLHKPPSRAQAQVLIRRFAAAGNIAFHPHCQSRMKKRKITSVQILNCLQKGYVDEDPYLSPGHEGWETAVTGSVAGRAIEGGCLSAMVARRSGYHMLLVNRRLL